ncbi:MAG: hypoxanthine phosphoribosyltransferase [Candidatus Binatia bacterium]
MPFFAQKGLTALLSKEAIQQRVAELGRRITADYAPLNGDLVLVGILKGSFVFFADLARAIDLPLTVDFVGLSSYRGADTSPGGLRLTQDLSSSVTGQHVLVVEDIVDTGFTMQFLLEHLAAQRPVSLRLAALLAKPERSRVDVHIDYLGFSIADHFVVGYGLDYESKYRNLPFVGVIEP